MNLVSLQKVSLNLGGRSVLNEIDLEIPEGGFQLILGPNGAGKSCLLKCLLGLLAYRGEVFLAGRSAQSYASLERAKVIGYVPQSLDLQFNLDVEGFLSLSRYAYDDESLTQRQQILTEVMAATETTHLATAYLDELSGGERQRVLIAAALAQKPRLLVLDEPTTAMDPGHRRDLVRLLDKLHRKEKLTIVVVTHDWNEFLHLHPQIVALRSGSVAFRCETHNLKDYLEGLFGCRFTHIEQAGHWLSLPEWGSAE